MSPPSIMKDLETFLERLVVLMDTPFARKVVALLIPPRLRDFITSSCIVQYTCVFLQIRFIVIIRNSDYGNY